ncbi:MAG: heat-inducible transcriptional repressor HrcA, partial [Alphaproteobacteria bacterium]
MRPNDLTHSLLSAGPTLMELDSRAREIFRRVVESYIETG